MIYLASSSFSYLKPLINPNDYSDRGRLVYGYLYLVTGSNGNSGSVVYSGSSITSSNSSFFTANYPNDNFTAISGSPSIRLINNIIPAVNAATQSYSNEWFCLAQQYPWGPDEINQNTRYEPIPLIFYYSGCI